MKHAFLVTVCALLIAACSRPANVQRMLVELELKEQIIEVSKRLYARELFSGTGGDISVRVPDQERFIVKATGKSVGFLDDTKLSTVTFDKEVVGGNPAPSAETEINAAIYSMRSDVGAILHMHSPFATAWATCGQTIPAVTQQSVLLLKSAGLIPYYRVGSAELLKSLTDLFQNPETSVVLMENHGTFVVGKDLEDLQFKAEVVENTARIAYFSKMLGTPREFVY